MLLQLEISWDRKPGAAGTKHATKQKADGSHVRRFTETWNAMACVLTDEDLLQKLSFGDVTSNGLFNHEKCLLLFATCMTQK